LQLVESFELPAAKQEWLAALAAAGTLARERPPDEYGCLYYSPSLGRFVVPRADSSLEEQGIVLHFGQPGGVLPRVADARIEGAPA